MSYFPITKLEGITGAIIEPAHEDGNLARLVEGVTISNFPELQGVTITNFPSSQGITGNVTVGNFPELQGVTVTNFPSTQAVTGTFWQETQPVSATSLPLPTGAATYDGQTAGNSSLVAINAGITGILLHTDYIPSQGQTAMAGSMPVVIANDQSIICVTAAQGVAGTTANAWYSKITDGITIAGVDTTNHLYVAGKGATGATATSNPVSVSGTDSNGIKRSILTDTTGKVSVFVSESTTPTISNVTMTNSNTEYSQALPTNCRRFSIQLRTIKDMKLSFTSGQSGTTYITIPGGGQYSEDTLNLTAKTLYFQSTTAGVIAEIVAWV